MAYTVDRVVICDAYTEPDAHYTGAPVYQLLSGGKSKRQPGRRSSMRHLASATAVKGGIAGIVGREASLFEDMLPSLETPKIKRGIDRGKDPATVPWGPVRDNDRHLSLADKRCARETMAERKSAP